MGFALIEIELSRAVPDLELKQGQSGVGLILRRCGWPVGFLLKDTADAARISASTVQRWIHDDPTIHLQTHPSESASPKALPHLTVAICTKDNPDKLGRCLHALARLRPASHKALPDEILVVDNAPSDQRTAMLIREFSNVRRVVEQRPGLNFARNCALGEARGEIVAYIDDDVVVDPRWLQGLQEAWSGHPNAAAFTGQTLPLTLDTDAQVLVEKLGGFRKGFRQICFGPTSATDPLYPCTTIFGNGCNMAFRRDVAIGLGGFDEALDTGAALPGGGDLDILYRVVRAGHPLVYEPRFLVFHEHRREFRKLRTQIRRSWGTGCMAWLVKVREQDPEQSGKARKFIAWWLRDLRAQLRLSLQGKHILPPSLVLAEICGAIEGLFGGYGRSVRRVEKIRKQFST